MSLLLGICIAVSVFGQQANFLPGVNYPIVTHGYNNRAAVGDVNGDKKPDVVSTNGDHTLSLLLGNGDGTLQNPTLVTVLPSTSTFYTQAVAVGDFNGDGKLDLAILCDSVDSTTRVVSGSIQIMLGNGDGTFQAPVGYSIDGSNPFTIQIADFNKDGKLDLAILNLASASVTILLGNGDGTFAAGVDYPLPSGTQPNGQAGAMAIGDLNGDGYPDVAVAGGTTTSGTISVFLTNSTGSLGTATNWITTTSTVCAESCAGPTSVAIGDVNNDGKPDLIADDGVEDGIIFLEGKGDGTFNAAIASAGAAAGGVGPDSAYMSLGDFNGDGKLDVAEAATGPYPGGPDLAIYFGKGDGTFQSPILLGEGTTPAVPNLSAATSISSADLNGDGVPDLVLATDAGFCTGCGPNAVTVVLNCGLRCTATNLTSSLSASMFDQPVTFTAVVSTTNARATGTPTGTVLFQDTGVSPPTSLGSATVASGTATFSFSGLSLGTHSVAATYQGDQNFDTSASSIVSQQVNPASTTTSISSSPNPSSAGQSVTFTAVVTPSTSGVPTGNVVFSDNGSQSVSVPLDSTGSASFSIASLSSGTHSITWTYNGDSNFLTSTSPTLSQIIGTSSSTLALSANRTSVTLGAGQSASFVLAVTPLTGFKSGSSVTFSCSGLPTLANCSFSPATVNSAGSVMTTNLSITTTGPHSGSASLMPAGRGVLAATSLLMVGVVLLPLSRSRGRSLGSFGLIGAALLAAVFVVSCGGGSGTPPPPPTPTVTPPGSYTVVVTASSGGSSQTQNLALTVTQ